MRIDFEQFLLKHSFREIKKFYELNLKPLINQDLNEKYFKFILKRIKKKFLKKYN